MTWAIEVDGLGKRYRLGRGHAHRLDSLYEAVAETTLDLASRASGGRFGRPRPSPSEDPRIEIQSEHLVLADSQFRDAPPGEFWALRDVSFRIDEGQRIGIIGRNGSGKSTMLKVLSRITDPTAGRYRYRGRLISLLEIGTGFHPDLTGRENIFLNATINGMSPRDTRAVFDEIVEFSELGRQIDTPIKRYSSGMYMRLAFSVAAHIRSEILVVDEVLAVGDAGFQRKCLAKMLDIGASGRTLLFVSHDMEAVRQLCSSAIELAHGEVAAIRPLAQPAAPQPGGTGLQAVDTAIADYSLDRGPRTQRRWEVGQAPGTAAGALTLLGVDASRDATSAGRPWAPDDVVSVAIDLLRAPRVGRVGVNLHVATVAGRPLAAAQGVLDVSGAAPAIRLVASMPPPCFRAGIFRLGVTLFDADDPREHCVVADAVDLVVDGPAEPPFPSEPSPPLAWRVDWRASAEPGGG